MKMRNKIERLEWVAVVALLCLFGMVGCKSTKKAESAGITGVKSARECLEWVEEQSFRYNTLSARLHVDVVLSDKEVGSRVDLKMVKDSALMLSVQPFLGIEVFRLMLTTDSIKVLDRMNKRYMAENYEQLRGKTPIEFNYYNLQALFTNHLFLPGQQELAPRLYNRFQVKQSDGSTELKAKDAMGLLYSFLTDGDGRLLSTTVTESLSEHVLFWSYADFAKVEDQIFPAQMQAELFKKGGSTGKVQFQFTRIRRDESLHMDFVIPSKYKRITFEQIVKSITK